MFWDCIFFFTFLVIFPPNLEVHSWKKKKKTQYSSDSLTLMSFIKYDSTSFKIWKTHHSILHYTEQKTRKHNTKFNIIWFKNSTIPFPNFFKRGRDREREREFKTHSILAWWISASRILRESWYEGLAASCW